MNTSSLFAPGVLCDFKSPKISIFEMQDGNTYTASFTLHKKNFGTIMQCKIMHQFLYSILFKIGIRNVDIVTSKHDPLTKQELLELPQVDDMSTPAWLYMKSQWRLKILQRNQNTSSSSSSSSTSTALSYNSSQLNDSTFLLYLWSEISKQTHIMCSRKDLEIITARQIGIATNKRKRSNNDR
tara:strand:+ start:370 stop:918 length:549 start_codon:yes stop_codon:yes gene_type:complete